MMREKMKGRQSVELYQYGGRKEGQEEGDKEAEVDK